MDSLILEFKVGAFCNKHIYNRLYFAKMFRHFSYSFLRVFMCLVTLRVVLLFFC